MNTLSDQIHEHYGFWGTSEELLQRAHQLAKLVGLDHTKINLRLVRYYSTEGVLDKPDRLGREAAYNFKHLLQLILARQLSHNGVSLSLVKSLTQKLDTNKLIQKIHNPVIDATEKLRLDPKIDSSKAKNLGSNLDLGKDYEKVIAQIDYMEANIYKLKSDIHHEFNVQSSIAHKFFDEQDIRMKSLEHLMDQYKSDILIRQSVMLRHIIVVDGTLSEIKESIKKIEAKLEQNKEDKG